MSASSSPLNRKIFFSIKALSVSFFLCGCVIYDYDKVNMTNGAHDRARLNENKKLIIEQGKTTKIEVVPFNIESQAKNTVNEHTPDNQLQNIAHGIKVRLDCEDENKPFTFESIVWNAKAQNVLKNGKAYVDKSTSSIFLDLAYNTAWKITIVVGRNKYVFYGPGRSYLVKVNCEE